MRGEHQRRPAGLSLRLEQERGSFARQRSDRVGIEDEPLGNASGRRNQRERQPGGLFADAEARPQDEGARLALGEKAQRLILPRAAPQDDRGQVSRVDQQCIGRRKQRHRPCPGPLRGKRREPCRAGRGRAAREHRDVAARIFVRVDGRRADLRHEQVGPVLVGGRSDRGQHSLWNADIRQL